MRCRRRRLRRTARGSDARDAWATGLTHKGEVLWKLGRQDEAREVFAQARKVAPKNAELAETLKRLNVQAGPERAAAGGTSGT
ncbi:tetratricopeptide repeat protein [Burkholderia anthina]|uniref:tetratricopeptide repeat protein n=1 Tax=Burkholderia anthina TaxID=179879 RepID=UPI001FC80C29|nr:tetratricopeptide repeat protein [Burkholderia anthina]